MGRIYLGIDNGVTGSIAVLGQGISPILIQTPVKTEIDYQISKTKRRTRIDHPVLLEFLQDIKTKTDMLGHDIFAVMERPMIQATRFDASLSASRAQESTLIAIETFGIAYQWIDSKHWQKEMLPAGAHGENLKLASKQIAKRYFPKLAQVIDKQTDGDALLMAFWAYRNNL